MSNTFTAFTFVVSFAALLIGLLYRLPVYLFARSTTLASPTRAFFFFAYFLSVSMGLSLLIAMLSGMTSWSAIQRVVYQQILWSAPSAAFYAILLLWAGIRYRFVVRVVAAISVAGLLVLPALSLVPTALSMLLGRVTLGLLPLSSSVQDKIVFPYGVGSGGAIGHIVLAAAFLSLAVFVYWITSARREGADIAQH